MGPQAGSDLRFRHQFTLHCQTAGTGLVHHVM